MTLLDVWRRRVVFLLTNERRNCKPKNFVINSTKKSNEPVPCLLFRRLRWEWQISCTTKKSLRRFMLRTCGVKMHVSKSFGVKKGVLIIVLPSFFSAFLSPAFLEQKMEKSSRKSTLFAGLPTVQLGHKYGETLSALPRDCALWIV